MVVNKIKIVLIAVAVLGILGMSMRDTIVRNLGDLWDVSTAGASVGDVMVKAPRGFVFQPIGAGSGGGGVSAFTALDFTGTTGFSDFTDNVDDGKWLSGAGNGIYRTNGHFTGYGVTNPQYVDDKRYTGSRAYMLSIEHVGRDALAKMRSTTPNGKTFVYGSRSNGMFGIKDSLSNVWNFLMNSGEIYQNNAQLGGEYSTVHIGESASTVGLSIDSYSGESDAWSSSKITTTNGLGAGVYAVAGNMVLQGRNAGGTGVYIRDNTGVTLGVRGGNVGVGTLVPEAKFHVNGDAFISGGLDMNSSEVEDCARATSLTSLPTLGQVRDSLLKTGKISLFDFFGASTTFIPVHQGEYSVLASAAATITIDADLMEKGQWFTLYIEGADINPVTISRLTGGLKYESSALGTSVSFTSNYHSLFIRNDGTNSAHR